MHQQLTVFNTHFQAIYHDLNSSKNAATEEKMHWYDLQDISLYVIHSHGVATA